MNTLPRSVTSELRCAVDGEALRRALHDVPHARLTRTGDDKRPALRRPALYTVEVAVQAGQPLVLTATDGHRLATADVPAADILPGEFAEHRLPEHLTACILDPQGVADWRAALSRWLQPREASRTVGVHLELGLAVLVRDGGAERVYAGCWRGLDYPDWRGLKRLTYAADAPVRVTVDRRALHRLVRDIEAAHVPGKLPCAVELQVRTAREERPDGRLGARQITLACTPRLVDQDPVDPAPCDHVDVVEGHGVGSVFNSPGERVLVSVQARYLRQALAAARGPLVTLHMCAGAHGTDAPLMVGECHGRTGAPVRDDGVLFREYIMQFMPRG